MNYRLFEHLCCQLWAMDDYHWTARLLRIAQAKEDTAIDAELPRRPTTAASGNPVPKMEVRGRLAIIPINGALVKGAQPSDRYFCGDVDYADVIEDLETAKAQGASSALLHITSPGGTVVGWKETLAAVEGSGLNTFAFADHWATSAAYGLAMATHRFFVAPSAITGSIGTISQREDLTGLLEHLGIKIETFTSGKLKAAGNPLTEMTKAHKAWAQETVDRYGDEFRNYVRMRRPGAEMPAGMMEGQPFNGAEAVKFGFADEEASTLEKVISTIGT